MNAQVPTREVMLGGGPEMQHTQPKQQDSSESEFELDLGPAAAAAADKEAASNGTARPQERKRMREVEDTETESEQDTSSDLEQAQPQQQKSQQQQQQQQPSKLAVAVETTGSADSAKGGAESGSVGGGSGSGKGQRLNAYLVESAFKLPLDFIRSHYRKPRPNEMRDLRRRAFEEAIVKDPGGLKGRHRAEPPDAKSVHMKRQSIMLAYAKLQRYQAEGKRPTDTQRLSERDQHISRCANYIMEYKKLRARLSAKKRKDAFGNRSEGVNEQSSTLRADQAAANERMTQLLLHIQRQQELREQRLCLLVEEQQRILSEALESQTRQEQHMMELDVKFKQLHDEKAMKLKR